ncbi:MAG: hypothetical protein L0Z73_15425 [Gammaproteobacteria bacterium]|nr:hypothetical protein [Gammaproteobacteria bacterium]
MKLKIAGVLILVAGTASVFATTHKSLNVEPLPAISGVASLVDGLGKELNMEMELVGLQPNSQYIARLENSACQKLPGEATAIPAELFVATYIESNQFGSYSAKFNGLPKYAEAARSVAIYSEAGEAGEVALNNVYCMNLG